MDLARSRRRCQPTDDGQQVRLRVASRKQETDGRLRPIVLVGHSAVVRTRETGVPERTLRRKAERFAQQEMPSLFAETTRSQSGSSIPTSISRG